MVTTSEIDRLLETVKAWSGRPLALATVIATWGSAPRPRGSHMLIADDGRFEGSVSGGCVEGEVLQAASDVIAGGGVRKLHFGVTNDRAWEVGLPCGGDIEILVQPVDEGGFPPALFETIADARAANRAVRIATDLTTGTSEISQAAGDDRFINRYAPPRRLLIVGAVQIAQSLAPIAALMDVRVTMIDPRGTFLTEERFPGVERDDRWPDEAVTAHHPGPATAVITLSHDPKIDDPALIAALRSDTAYIAALGSTRSHAKRLERLREAGFTDTDLARIDAPAGLSIGAQGPAEIALSIAAGMIQAFRGN